MHQGDPSLKKWPYGPETKILKIPGAPLKPAQGYPRNRFIINSENKK